jgi:hypothetical protein
MRLPGTESNPSRESTKPAFLATRGIVHEQHVALAVAALERQRRLRAKGLPIPTLKGKEALPC